MNQYREYREHVKDLSGLSKDLGRIVLVDNNPFSFLLQPLNGIPCIPFSAGQLHDTQVGRSNCVNFYTLITSLLFITHLPLRRLFISFHFPTPLFFSFWMFFFHCLSTCRCRKMWDLFFMRGFTCLNGFKSRESLQLVGNSRIGISSFQFWAISLFKAVSSSTPTILLYSITVYTANLLIQGCTINRGLSVASHYRIRKPYFIM